MTPHPDLDRHPSPEPDPDALSRLLDAWQPAPELSAGFAASLRRRLAAEEPPPARGWAFPRFRWAGALATLVLLVGAGLFFARANRTAVPPVPVAIPAPQMARNDLPVLPGDALTRDLQTLSRDQDLLNHLDFLSTPAPQAAPAPQERD